MRIAQDKARLRINRTYTSGISPEAFLEFRVTGVYAIGLYGSIFLVISQINVEHEFALNLLRDSFFLLKDQNGNDLVPP